MAGHRFRGDLYFAPRGAPRMDLACRQPGPGRREMCPQRRAVPPGAEPVATTAVSSSVGLLVVEVLWSRAPGDRPSRSRRMRPSRPGGHGLRRPSSPPRPWRGPAIATATAPRSRGDQDHPPTVRPALDRPRSPALRSPTPARAAAAPCSAVVTMLDHGVPAPSAAFATSSSGRTERHQKFGANGRVVRPRTSQRLSAQPTR